MFDFQEGANFFSSIQWDRFSLLSEETILFYPLRHRNL